MDIETITKLIDAGYTKEDIKALESAGNEGAGNESAGNEGAGNEGVGNESAGNESSQNLNIDAAIKALTDTVNGLTATVKAMQDANAGKAHTDTPKAGDAIKAAMDSFIEKL